jgi:hypothetical protein
MGQQQGAGADPRRGRRRLAAGMTAADHDDVVLLPSLGHRHGIYGGPPPLSRMRAPGFCL